MCDIKKIATEFESRLIWNYDETECFLPEEFSDAKVWGIEEGTIDVSLKNGHSISHSRSPDIEKAKIRLQELMKEIGEKLKMKTGIYKYTDPETGESFIR